MSFETVYTHSFVRGSARGVSQRQSMRRAVRVECEVVRERDFRLVGREAMDVSPAGMFLRSELPILTGEEVLVTMRIPRSDTWLDCQGSVARVVHGRRPGDVCTGVGLRFEALDLWSQLILQAALRGVPPPLPVRARRIDENLGWSSLGARGWRLR